MRPATRLGRHRRCSPERPWEPLSDAERAVLSPFVSAPPRPPAAPSATPGAGSTPCLARRQHPPRPRAPAPGRLPAGFGEPDTASRQFRRWARLLQALADAEFPAAPCHAGSSPGSAAPSAALGASWAFPAWRWHGAWASSPRLRGPSWLLPDPDFPNTSSGR
jgi:hypothetical protein